VPRAKRFNRSEVDLRPKKLQVDPVLIETLIQKAVITDQAQRKDFEYELTCAITSYRGRVLADSEERPARIVAALKPGLKPATSVLKWLNSLPQSVRHELRAGGIEGLLEALISRTKNRVAHWQAHVAAHRPVGQGAASSDLLQSLTQIIATHRPDMPERYQLTWIAFAARKIGARFPDEKKNRRRFTGAGKHKPEA
jgi:hypothetical protein